jgi:hypothetical protein
MDNCLVRALIWGADFENHAVADAAAARTLTTPALNHRRAPRFDRLGALIPLCATSAGEPRSSNLQPSFAHEAPLDGDLQSPSRDLRNKHRCHKVFGLGWQQISSPVAQW